MLETIARPPIATTLPSLGADGAVTIDRSGLRVSATQAGKQLVALHLDEPACALHVKEATGDMRAIERALSAIIEAVFSWLPTATRLDLIIDLDVEPGVEIARHLCRCGLAHAQLGRLTIQAGPFMQRRDNWLADAEVAPYPLDYVLSEGRRHPRRRPKPHGTVYARRIQWLDAAISFRALTIEDLALFHRWMNDSRVAAFWDEAGSMEAHRDYLAKLIADPHMLPLIGCFGDRPFGYFEVYWAKENRIAPFYDAGDYDRGWHVAIGEEAFRGRRYISAWLPSLMHYLFLDDPRTNRIVGEPASAHVQQIRNLEVSGFAKLKSFDFPHKRATLVMLLREKFFGDRLWLPAGAASGCA